MTQEEIAPALESESSQGISPEDFIASREEWEREVESIKKNAMQTLDPDALAALKAQTYKKIGEVEKILGATYDVGDARSWMDKLLKRGMSLGEQQQILKEMESQTVAVLDLIVERSQGDPWEVLGLQKEVARQSLFSTAEMLVGLASEEVGLSDEEIREVTKIGNEVIESALRRATGLMRSGGFKKVQELLVTDPESAADGVEKIREAMNELIREMNSALQEVLGGVIEQKKATRDKMKEELSATELAFGQPPRIDIFPTLSEIVDLKRLSEQIRQDKEASRKWFGGEGKFDSRVSREIGKATGEWVNSTRFSLHESVEAHLKEAERIYREEQVDLSAQMKAANGDLSELVRLDSLSYQLSWDHVAHVKRTYDISLEEQRKITEWVEGIYREVGRMEEEYSRSLLRKQEAEIDDLISEGERRIEEAVRNINGPKS